MQNIFHFGLISEKIIEQRDIQYKRKIESKQLKKMEKNDGKGPGRIVHAHVPNSPILIKSKKTN